MEIDTNQLLLPKQACDIVCLSLSNFYQYASFCDTFPKPILIDGRKFWKLEDLKQWKKPQRRNAKQQPERNDHNA